MPVELQPPAAEQSAKSYVLNENFAGVSSTDCSMSLVGGSISKTRPSESRRLLLTLAHIK